MQANLEDLQQQCQATLAKQQALLERQQGLSLQLGIEEQPEGEAGAAGAQLRSHQVHAQWLCSAHSLKQLYIECRECELLNLGSAGLWPYPRARGSLLLTPVDLTLMHTLSSLLYKGFASSKGAMSSSIQPLAAAPVATNARVPTATHAWASCTGQRGVWQLIMHVATAHM